MDSVVSAAARPLAAETVPRAPEIPDRSSRAIGPVAGAAFPPDSQPPASGEATTQGTTIAVVSVEITYVHTGGDAGALDVMA